MRFRCWLPLAFIGLLLLGYCFVPIVHGGTLTVTISWQEFNQAATGVAHAYPGVKKGVTGNFTEWTITVTHNCIFHSAANTSYYFGICIYDDNLTTSIPFSTFRYALHFYVDGVKYVYTNGTAAFASAKFAYTLPLTISYTNGTVTLKDATNTILGTPETAFEPLSPNYILYKTNLMDTDTLADGELKATIDYPHATIDMGLIMAWMPVILTFAMLSITLSMLKKVGRW